MFCEISFVCWQNDENIMLKPKKNLTESPTKYNLVSMNNLSKYESFSNWIMYAKKFLVVF